MRKNVERCRLVRLPSVLELKIEYHTTLKIDTNTMHPIRRNFLSATKYRRVTQVYHIHSLRVVDVVVFSWNSSVIVGPWYN